ncbi:hypothetical protein H4J58_13660 [Colwellia sp. MB3u-70]|nr:hypothetical protein [Colwellia sp. MB3u-70]
MGKGLANAIVKELTSGDINKSHDSSTKALT